VQEVRTQQVLCNKLEDFGFTSEAMHSDDFLASGRCTCQNYPLLATRGKKESRTNQSFSLAVQIFRQSLNQLGF